MNPNDDQELCSASSSIVNSFSNQVNREDVKELFNVQQQVLDSLDKSNERLTSLNKISAQRYLQTSKQFEKHRTVLTTMKTDLDNIFKRIKFIRNQLNLKYPTAFSKASEENPELSDDENESEDNGNLPLKTIPNSTLVKSKTIDCSQVPTTIKESISLAQLNNVEDEGPARSFEGFRRFVLENSTPSAELGSLLRNARDELKKFNDGFLSSGNSSKSKKN